LDRNTFLACIWEASDAGKLLPACAWCGFVRIQDEWIDPPPGAISTIDASLMLSHSICPSCIRAAQEQAASHA
jgi:hypothetical protein